MVSRVRIAGVGMSRFSMPRRSENYDVLAVEAITAALTDSGVELADIDQAYAGYVYGDSTSGQNSLYQVGLPGVPVVNVNNNCSTGSTALWLARQAVESGAARCVLAFGFEQMRPGALGTVWDDRPSPFDRFTAALDTVPGSDPGAPLAARLFGGAGAAYAERYDTRPDLFARIAVKARLHAAANPNAVLRDPVTVEEVMAAPAVFGPLTRSQCCPPTCGAAAVLVCDAGFARERGLDARVGVVAQSMTTDRPVSFEGDPIDLVGADMTRRAAARVYEAAGIGPEDIPVVELHDCFTTNEVLTYEALGLTGEGTAERFVLDGENTYGGRVVTNPSGGLLSKGHPLGASGLAQCAELVWQLEGRAGDRQVEGARVGLQHNIGLGGACVVTLYQRED
ncbi:lipid-transfer protein [Nocardiopsis sp. NPDC007018]|uniref:lipid-transfer protein n=1 Tax=Nocardiopsis sp. NPDC007018 TaxID=3155721 RepID=UPI00340B0740